MSRILSNARFVYQARGIRAAVRYVCGILEMLGP